MSASHHNTAGLVRSSRMLRTALGAAIARHLDDPAVVEVMLNPDGRIWIDRLSEGLSDTRAYLAPEDGERIIRLVAHHVGAEVHATSPRVSAELPESGERFEGLLPPLVTAPAFAIRKAVVTVPRALIAETINLIAVLSGRGPSRRLSELARVEGLGPDGDYRVVPALATDHLPILNRLGDPS